jgi:hypothetical protein
MLFCSLIKIDDGDARNDSLLLSALPSLAMHGAVAYLAMLGVQIFLCTVSMRLK